VDADVVDISNLQRQIIHTTAEKGTLKVESAKKQLTAINPSIRIDTFPVRIDQSNAREISQEYDILVDGTDNIPSRYLLNDLAVLTHRPYIYGSIYRFEGQVSVFGLPDGPCYRCLFPEPPPPGFVPSCATAGVMGVLPGIVGTLQAAEVIKLITGAGKTLSGRLMLVDALEMSMETVNVRKRKDCRLCGEHPEIHELIDYDFWCGTGPEADLGLVGDGHDIDVKVAATARSEDPSMILLDVREPFEKELADIPNSYSIPMEEIPARMSEIPKDKHIVVYCRNGIRSAQITRQLIQAGYQNIKNLRGGINAWADQVDPAIIQY
jgi:adenylyltransferase/sulfurtransferase